MNALDVTLPLPLKMDFYHRGELSREAIEWIQKKDALNIPGGYPHHLGISFNLFTLSDQISRLILIFMVPKDASLELYQEVGNVLASRLANELSQDSAYMPEPPRILTGEQIAKVLRGHPKLLFTRYYHREGNQSLTIDTLILPIASGGSTHV